MREVAKLSKRWRFRLLGKTFGQFACPLQITRCILS